jgi:dipeptide/tripeptide permease
MYALTYAAVHTWDTIPFFSTRSLYMAVIMVAPMIILMLIFMDHMYEDKKRNVMLYSISVLLFVLFFTFIRQQTFVNNVRFIDSMIPHHSSAITMCEKADITDHELSNLCNTIIQAQQDEINQMKAIRVRLSN